MPIGIQMNEKDYSLYTNTTVTAPVLAIVGTATKGPVGVPTLCTSQREFRDKFGNLNPDCYGTYAAQHFLSASSRVYYTRVAGDDAVKATVSIDGATGEGQDIADQLILEVREPGEFYNGYAVVIDNVTLTGFDLTIKTSETGSVVTKLAELTLNEGDENYVATKLLSTPIDLKTIADVSASVKEGTYIIAGGTNGTEGIESACETALDAYKSDIYDIDLLIAPGQSDASVINKGLSVCESRGDAIFLVDPPSGLTYTQVADWHNGAGEYTDHLAFNSSYGACYWAWQYVRDEINNVDVLVPPSVLVAPVYARNDSMARPWYAPAGLTRGIIKDALRSETIPDSSMQSFLYETPNNINCIITNTSAGLVVFGQKTLSRNDTALDRINVRRLVTYIKRVVKRVCQTLVFEPNDSATWNRFHDLIDPTLRNLKGTRGLYDYKIVKGRDIVTDDDIDNYRMPAQILIKPTKSAEYIPVDIVITSTGAEFNDYIQAYN